jgi:hypothetical protein
MKKSRLIAIISLFMLAVIPAVAAWMQMPKASNFKFAAEPAHVVNVAPMTVTNTDTVTIPEVAIIGSTTKSRGISHKVVAPTVCQLHELIQQGSPTARFVRVCG